MSLQQQLETIRTDLEARIPKPALHIMHQATKELVDSGIEKSILQPGESLPTFSLADHEDHIHESPTLLQDKPLVLTFYRGLWCPYCNADLAYLASIHSQITELGGQLYAISPQLAQYSRQIRKRHQIDFPILTDHGNIYAEKLGLRFQLPSALLKLYRDSFHIDLPSYHGEDSWTLPMPARFVIGTDETIHYAEASADYTQRPDPDALLTILAALTD